MKRELENFNEKEIKEIYENYKVRKKLKRNSNFRSDLRKKTKYHENLLHYKNLLDSGKIKEEDIPKEYFEDLRKLYYEEIAELKIKLNHKKGQEFSI